MHFDYRLKTTTAGPGNRYTKINSQVISHSHYTPAAAVNIVAKRTVCSTRSRSHYKRTQKALNEIFDKHRD